MGWSSGGTLVAHGALDRALPVAHAEALANGIDGSSLRIIDEMGHIPRHGDWLAIAAGVRRAGERIPLRLQHPTKHGAGRP